MCLKSIDKAYKYFISLIFIPYNAIDLIANDLNIFLERWWYMQFQVYFWIIESGVFFPISFA